MLKNFRLRSSVLIVGVNVANELIGLLNLGTSVGNVGGGREQIRRAERKT